MPFAKLPTVNSVIVHHILIESGSISSHSPMEGKNANGVKLNAFVELIPWILTNTRDRRIVATISGSRKRSSLLLDWIVHV